MEFCIIKKSRYTFVSTKRVFLLHKWQEAVIMLSSQLNKYDVKTKMIF